MEKEGNTVKTNPIKKKLIIASDCFIPRWDGITRFLIEIIPKLKEDYEITIIAPEFSGEFNPIEGINIIRFPTSKLMFADINFSWFYYFKIKKLIKEQNAELVKFSKLLFFEESKSLHETINYFSDSKAAALLNKINQSEEKLTKKAAVKLFDGFEITLKIKESFALKNI